MAPEGYQISGTEFIITWERGEKDPQISPLRQKDIWQINFKKV